MPHRHYYYGIINKKSFRIFAKMILFQSLHFSLIIAVTECASKKRRISTYVKSIDQLELMEKDVKCFNSVTRSRSSKYAK